VCGRYMYERSWASEGAVAMEGVLLVAVMVRVGKRSGATQRGQAGGVAAGGDTSTSDVGSGGCLESTGYGDIFGTGENGGQGEVVYEERYELRFAVDPRFMEKIERVKRLVSTKRRGTLDFEGLFELLMDDYLERHSPEGRMKRRKKRAQKARQERKKEHTAAQALSKETDEKARSGGIAQPHGSQKKSRRDTEKPSNSKRSRYIPQSVSDEAYLRDGGRCSFVGANGRRR
jgi:hypothetical protein